MGRAAARAVCLERAVRPKQAAVLAAAVPAAFPVREVARVESLAPPGRVESPEGAGQVLRPVQAVSPEPAAPQAAPPMPAVMRPLYPIPAVIPHCSTPAWVAMAQEIEIARSVGGTPATARPIFRPSASCAFRSIGAKSSASLS